VKALAAIVLASVLAASCGGSDAVSQIAAGRVALGSGDTAAALEAFRDALDHLDPSSSQYFEAKIGAVEALIAVDPDRARDEFLELARQHPDRVEPNAYVYIAGHLANGKHFTHAVEVVDAGIKRFGANEKNEKLKALIERIKKEATTTGDIKALKALAGLGYIG
jgi:hypothetical protein